MGFLVGICMGALGLELGFMGLGPGGDPRRVIWLAELDRGRPISGGGAICGPPPYGPGDMERGCWA